MVRLYLAIILLFVICCHVKGQTNILSTNPDALQVLKGNYNPLTYISSNIISRHDSIAEGIQNGVSKDSLRSYLEVLATFHNRNTASDTVSTSTGIGAARRWVYSKFQQFGAANDNRLVPSYLQFDAVICGATQFRNIFAVLPGMDTTDKSVIIIEGHIDSRCAGECDLLCPAHGMEDNGSGTSLVIELARVMSRFTFNHTLVFLCTIGEEQGLFGAEAFADFCQQEGITVKGVLNNDVIGGVLCGHTSSPPSCPGYGHIDSTHVRLFSFGTFNSFHKQLARFSKLEYKEELLPYVTVPMELVIMAPEDRTGRGGDHIPFRQHGMTAIRFTSANESGNANVADTGYHDRQHTSDDILGVDTDFDSVIDSFFVDFGYLSRNTAINGNTAAMMAIGPLTPDFTVTAIGSDMLRVEITQQTQYPGYRIGVRTNSNDWDSVYAFYGTLVDTITVSAAPVHYLSVAAMDSNDVESLFSHETLVHTVGIEEVNSARGIELLQNQPNPLDETTVIAVFVSQPGIQKEGTLVITDAFGKEIIKNQIPLNPGLNEAAFDFGKQLNGIYFYTLLLNQVPVSTKKMVISKQ